MPDITVSAVKNPLNPNSLTFDEDLQRLQNQEDFERKQRELEKRSPFSRWTQFNNEHTKELMTLALKYPKAHAILYFLVDQMDEYNAIVCSYKVLQEVLGISQATCARAIKTLKDLGFIAVLKSGSGNVYAINDTVYWKSWGNNRQYSKFPANVILAKSEQDDFKQITFNDLETGRFKELKVKE